ncbi:MAG: enoyl-CoA hydratase/isomerase family protein, partial [Promethearchaeota archaeon]
MNFENLIYEEREKTTAFITLNRPEVKNALSMKLSDELVSAIEIIRKSRKLKFLVIKGAGNNFCVGDDITEMPRWGDANDITRRARYYQNMANQLEELDKITIAAVDGYAVGGGLEITMAVDFVIATERSKWGMPEVDVGITPGWGGTTRLARLIGRRRAKEINLLGALHSGKKAVEWNLWNRLVPNNELDNEVEKLLEVLKSKNQQGMRQLKFIINRGVECDLYTAQGFEVMSAGLTGAV